MSVPTFARIAPIRRISLFFFCLVVLTWSRQAQSATYNVPGDFTTIQDAINAAASGDTVAIGPGTYPESLTVINKTVHLHGAGPDTTILDPSSGPGGRGIYVSGVGPMSISGLTIQNGTDLVNHPVGWDGGAGILILPGTGSSPAISNCRFFNNVANNSAAIRSHYSYPTITNCVFTGNTSTSSSGGAIGIGAGGSVIIDCTFIGNSAPGAGGIGGAIHSTISTSVITRCTFEGNTAYAGGAVISSSTNSTISDCSFNENSTTWVGGALSITGASTSSVTNCRFQSNSTVAFGGAVEVGGHQSPSVSLLDCEFENNSSVSAGGAVIWGSPNGVLARCRFTGNSAGSGGAVDQLPVGGMQNCSFVGNSGTRGGALRVSSNASVTNCLFAGNTSTQYGGAMEASGTNGITNCTFYGNTAAIGGGGLYHGNANTATIRNSVFWANAPNQITGSETVNYCNIQAGYAGTGNLNADPLFVNPAGGDLRLQSGSPCKDAGDNSAMPAGITTDLDGNPRINGDTVDMGAFEFQGPSTPEEVAEALLEDIVELVEEGALSNGNGNALSAKLESALDALEASNTEAAIGKVGAFINQVEALINAGRLSAEDGQALLDLGNALLDYLGG